MSHTVSATVNVIQSKYNRTTWTAGKKSTYWPQSVFVCLYDLVLIIFCNNTQQIIFVSEALWFLCRKIYPYDFIYMECVFVIGNAESFYEARHFRWNSTFHLLPSTQNPSMNLIPSQPVHRTVTCREWRYQRLHIYNYDLELLKMSRAMLETYRVF
jgi:hypothetical protein